MPQSENHALVSVIVPVYNAQNTLDACVRSVLAQTRADWELILVNDGSKDDSLSICERYARADARIRAFDQPNGGVSAARNQGLAMATGTYVAFLDSDDYWDAAFLETLVSEMETSGADAALCGYRIQQPDLSWREIRVREATCENEASIGAYFAAQNVAINMLWNKLYIRARIADFFDPAMSLGEDLKFNLAYFENARKMRCVSAPLYAYCFNGSSSLGNRFKENNFELAKWQYEHTARFIVSRVPDADLFITRREIATNAWRYLRKLVSYGGFAAPEAVRRIGFVLSDAVWRDVFAPGLACNKQMKLLRLCVRLRLKRGLYWALRARGERG